MEVFELTPSQLQKAELMFFWSRYPDSMLLKTYFPEIQDENQLFLLERRFCGFRYIFYNQIERFAWQAINENVNSVDDLRVNRKSEIFKVFKSLFNRNNNINIPDEFLQVIEYTLREYFCHIQSSKNAKIERPPKKVTLTRKLRDILGLQKVKNEIKNEATWEHFISTAVSKMDETVPEYFKSSDFLTFENSCKPLNREAFTHKLNSIYTNRLKKERQ